jgi:hypothetical protein
MPESGRDGDAVRIAGGEDGRLAGRKKDGFLRTFIIAGGVRVFVAQEVSASLE